MIETSTFPLARLCGPESVKGTFRVVTLLVRRLTCVQQEVHVTLKYMHL